MANPLLKYPVLWRMKRFYLAHSTPEFLAPAVRELGFVLQNTPKLREVSRQVCDKEEGP